MVGGALALDEHVGNSRLAASLGSELHRWAEAAVLPRYRTLPPEALQTLPDEPHSALEDSSVSQVLPLVSSLFKVQLLRPRHVFLDHYPLLYYLDVGRDLEGFRHALAIANRMQELVRAVDPEGGDYITLVAENTRAHRLEEQAPETQSEPGLTAAAPPTQENALQEQVGALQAQLAEQSAWARDLEGELQRKNAELARLRAHVRRLESGRLMRLLRRLPGQSGRGH